MDFAAASPQMWITLALLGLALALYVSEKLPVEVVSAGLLAVMLVAFQLMPVLGPTGRNLLSPDVLLAGFGNPALIAVMALLVVGEALSRTGALDGIAEAVQVLKLPPWGLVVAVLAVVTVTSAFINDTPVVVMFLPIIQAVALRARMAPGQVMMPLSFAAILGGMTTLIGSSTNLLVSSALISMGLPELGFFDQTPMGVLLASVGFAYMVVVMPRLLPKRGAPVGATLDGGGKQFVSQCVVPAGSPLAGAQAQAGLFKPLPDITVHLIVREGRPEFPPYDDFVLQPGDTLMVAGTRKALADTAARFPDLLAVPEESVERGRPRDGDGDERVLVEAMVPPTSRFVGFTLDQLGLQRLHNLGALGIERRARMVRGPMSDIRLQSGDVLLLTGRWPDIDQLRGERDLVVVSGSVGALPQVHHARTAILIFIAMLGLSAFGLLPIAVAALLAATALVALGALTGRQAIRAIDYKVVLLVGAALALGEAMDVTGAARFMANAILGAMGDVGAWGALVAYFGIVAAITNVLSNNATAVLFTPIGVGLARSLGIDPMLFAIATILASNCSFATPIGYQTNLLVMGPGHYRFADYVKAGLPLTLLLWAAFAVGAKLVWGL
ncbi:MAG TPA: SLC13 family permease [Candidatus Omnitrophota bacterium]|nr:SLC13 family permease [Candidatus Omnitrophota bacterium]